MKRMIVFKIFVILFMLSNGIDIGHSKELELTYLKPQAFKLYQEKKYEKSIEVTKTALQIAEADFGDESLEAAEYIGNLGALYRLIGKETEGKKLLEEARKIREKHGVTGVPLGIQTEIFFDLVDRRRNETLENMRQQGLEPAPQESIHYEN